MIMMMVWLADGFFLLGGLWLLATLWSGVGGLLSDRQRGRVPAGATQAQRTTPHPPTHPPSSMSPPPPPPPFHPAPSPPPAHHRPHSWLGGYVCVWQHIFLAPGERYEVLLKYVAATNNTNTAAAAAAPGLDIELMM